MSIRVQLFGSKPFASSISVDTITNHYEEASVEEAVAHALRNHKDLMDRWTFFAFLHGEQIQGISEAFKRGSGWQAIAYGQILKPREQVLSIYNLACRTYGMDKINLSDVPEPLYPNLIYNPAPAVGQGTKAKRGQTEIVQEWLETVDKNELAKRAWEATLAACKGQ